MGFAATAKRSFKGLSTGAHNLAHCRLSLSEEVRVTITIVVYDPELDVLLLFKPVSHCDASPPVRVQIIVDLLGLADLDPTTILPLVNHTLGV